MVQTFCDDKISKANRENSFPKMVVAFFQGELASNKEGNSAKTRQFRSLLLPMKRFIGSMTQRSTGALGMRVCFIGLLMSEI